ncbi:PAP2 superfamily protein [Fulvivirga imtechensis AK7]|uniref:PAP2 superfamily protein n=1 Tax=Fulvivirga imtechensis AK7 TaxID=1237149 RepID=L8JM38_9BACT|nr:phosphatase PAP2 family protein [Fulvivirga imtechensis]ELR69273.1 PAP2 superfamily protein [Fulvivirga imtechensis AK7]
MMRAAVLALIIPLFFSSPGVRAQDKPADTTSIDIQTRKKWHQTNLFKATAVPLALTGVGLYAASERAPVNRFGVQKTLTAEFPGFASTLDDYLRYGPPVVVYGLDLLGVESKNNFKHKTIIFLKANIIGYSLGFALKGITKVRRPDNSSSASFPSLHTTQAFLGATFMHKELGHRSPWYSIVAYTAASITGFYRLLNNKHWLSDVLVGAALGILSVNVAYLTHKYRGSGAKRNQKVSVIIAPSFSLASYGFSAALLLK